MRGAKLLWLAALLGLLAGCGLDRTAELSGTVKFDGKPLASGTLWVVGEDGKKLHSGIGPKGQYAFQGVAKGKAVFYVDVHGRVPPGLGGGPAPSLPVRYARAETSGLSVEVTGGDQKFDIEMKPAPEKEK